MTQTPPGWYPEPDPAYNDQPGRLRYWDGAVWTDHVHATQPAYPGLAPAASVAPVAVTPDGVPLAGWWKRVFALVMDGFIAIPFYLVAIIPVVIWQWHAWSAWFDDLMFAADNGTPRPDDPAMLDPSTSAGFAFVMSIVVATIVYNLVFLRWKQATPGKLILGLRVRRRETPGPLPWSTIIIRVGFIGALSALGQLPVIGALFAVGTLVDYLWPLWDSKKQALHDKVAGTNVIAVR